MTGFAIVHQNRSLHFSLYGAGNSVDAAWRSFADYRAALPPEARPSPEAFAAVPATADAVETYLSGRFGVEDRFPVVNGTVRTEREAA